jgi:hypothetical protein
MIVLKFLPNFWPHFNQPVLRCQNVSLKRDKIHFLAAKKKPPSAYPAETLYFQTYGRMAVPVQLKEFPLWIKHVSISSLFLLLILLHTSVLAHVFFSLLRELNLIIQEILSCVPVQTFYYNEGQRVFQSSTLNSCEFNCRVGTERIGKEQ